MKKVLIASSIWGHESIAKGVRDALKNSDFETRLVVIRIDPFTETAYKTFYRFLPKLFKTAFKLGKYKLVERVAERYLKNSYYELIEKSMKGYRPDIVISTYLGFNTSIESLKSKFRFDYFNVIPDPWTFTKIQFSQKGTNLVFDKYSMTKIGKNAPIKSAEAIGWFVESKFNTGLTKKDARKTLGIDPTMLTLCITGGSEGAYDILKIANSFINLKRKIQILFMCGKNKQLFDMAASLSKILSKNKKIRLYPYKFTARMNLFMNASDLVIGKAGPNTIFESVACGVPFFAVSHISGQEDGNLELIRKYNVGYAEENPAKIAKILKSLIENPSILKKFQKPIQALSQHNQGSRPKLLKLLRG